jgi:hypothetical protein
MLVHLTAARLKTLEEFFKTTSESDLYGCYAWTQAVGAALLPILGDLEVSLRNALHRGLSQYYGNTESFEWMLKTRPNRSSPGGLTSWHKLSTRTHEDVLGAVEKIKKSKGKGCRVTVDDIVAKVAFGFWEAIVNGLKHNSHPKGMQERVLAVAFPSIPDLSNGVFGDPALVDRIASLLYQMRDVRNRIGHHDSLWKTAEFDAYGRRGFVPRRPRQTVTSMRLLADQIAWFAGWIDPRISLYIKATPHWRHLQWLLTRDTLFLYRENGWKAVNYEKTVPRAQVNKIKLAPKRKQNGGDKVFGIRRRRLLRSMFY